VAALDALDAGTPAPVPADGDEGGEVAAAVPPAG
jgi:hypothetical protein